MQSMKVALRNVGIQLGPQEMCEALRLADLDGGRPSLPWRSPTLVNLLMSVTHVLGLVLLFYFFLSSLF